MTVKSIAMTDARHSIYGNQVCAEWENSLDSHMLPPGGACKDRPDMWAPRTGAVLGDLQKPSEMHGRPQVQQPLRLDAYAMRLLVDAAGST